MSIYMCTKPKTRRSTLRQTPETRLLPVAFTEDKEGAVGVGRW